MHEQAFSLGECGTFHEVCVASLEYVGLGALNKETSPGAFGHWRQKERRILRKGTTSRERLHQAEFFLGEKNRV